jgi:hypothetical protein
MYQHCDEKHLHRYVAEFDFRYNHRVKLGYSDGERAALAVAQCPTPNTQYSSLGSLFAAMAPTELAPLV